MTSPSMQTRMSDVRQHHVESLKYKHTLASENRRFVEGFRQVTHLGNFHCILDAEHLQAIPIQQVASVEEAQTSLEPHLRGWELRSEVLANNRVRFRRAGHLVRTHDEGHVVGVGVASEVELTSSVTHILTSTRIEIPKGPPLQEVEEAERIVKRWRDVLEQGERLLVGSYWVLTETERYFSGRRNASTSLSISLKALNHLGRLCARNDPEHGRKAKTIVDPLSQAEVQWIQAFIPKLILRVAEKESAVPGLRQITMADLPNLK